MKKMYVLFLLIFAIFTFNAYSQVTTSAIRGTVMAENSEPLAGATIVAVQGWPTVC